MGQAIGNGWLVGDFGPVETDHESWRLCAGNNNHKSTMKKMILLAAMIGLGATLAARADGAKDNYDTLCAKCHGAAGKGDTKMGTRLGVKDFTDPKVQTDIKDDAAFKAIKEGLKSDDGKTLMKPFDSLSDDDAKALVAYIRTLKQ